MSRTHPVDVAASVRQRLLNRARDQGQDYQYVLGAFAVERLLYRLSRSPHRDRFVLKGATLFTLWSDLPHRATWDLDLLARAGGSVDEVVAAMQDIVRVPVEDDGLVFDAASIEGALIREGTEHGGVRVRLEARLARARIPVQVDVGVGDAPYPAPVEMPFPTMLAMPAPRLHAYARETVIAEKLDAMIVLGSGNSRLKDFYDVDFLARSCAFDGAVLAEAVRRTLAARGTPAPAIVPIALTPGFGEDPARAQQWRGFLRRARLAPEACSLAEAIGRIRVFLEPLLAAVSLGRPWERRWPPGGPWTEG